VKRKTTQVKEIIYLEVRHIVSRTKPLLILHIKT